MHVLLSEASQLYRECSWPILGVIYRLAMDEPNLQCAPKAKEFVVPTTQLPNSASKDGHRIHTSNVRYSL